MVSSQPALRVESRSEELEKNNFGHTLRTCVVTSLFYLYKLVISPALQAVAGAGYGCRFDESCSAYSKRILIGEGFLVGGPKALKRILSCQPYFFQKSDSRECSKN